MQYGPYAVDYEYRPYNPERMRNERVAKAQASIKKHGLGALMAFDYDYQRYLGYYSFHQYNRRRLGHFALLIEGAKASRTLRRIIFSGTWDESRMPWFKGKMVLETAKTFAIQQALPDHPNYVPRPDGQNRCRSQKHVGEARQGRYAHWDRHLQPVT